MQAPWMELPCMLKTFHADFARPPNHRSAHKVLGGEGAQGHVLPALDVSSAPVVDQHIAGPRGKWAMSGEIQRTGEQGAEEAAPFTLRLECSIPQSDRHSSLCIFQPTPSPTRTRICAPPRAQLGWGSPAHCRAR